MAQNGSQVLLFVYDKDYTDIDKYIPVDEQTGLSQEESVNLIEVSHKAANHTKFIYGREDGTLSLEAQVVDGPKPEEKGFLVLENCKKNRKMVYLKRAQVVNGEIVAGSEQYVEALVENISRDYPDNDAATLSVDLQLNDSFSATAPTIDDANTSGSITA